LDWQIKILPEFTEKLQSEKPDVKKGVLEKIFSVLTNTEYKDKPLKGRLSIPFPEYLFNRIYSSFFILDKPQSIAEIKFS
jgi:hypothetical protein